MATSAGPRDEPIAPDLLADLASAVADGGPDPALRERIAAITPALLASALPADGHDPYSRRILHSSADVEVMVAQWRPEHRCAPHDHGGSSGFVQSLAGTFDEQRYRWSGSDLTPADAFAHPPGDPFSFGPAVVHDMAAGADGGVTLHVYAPGPEHMYVYDVERRLVHDIRGDHGAWLPTDVHPTITFEEAAARAGAPGDRPSIDGEDRVGSYDKVAELYDRAYVDITVREAEWAWISGRADALRRTLGRRLRIVEVGCGNGSLLRELDGRGDVAEALGLDESDAQVDRAHARSGAAHPRLRFARIEGSTIDLPDSSVDVALSFLSFRYLDWPAVAAEVRRVLAPGGRLWVVDMVRQPLRLREVPLFVRSAVHHVLVPRRHPQFARDVATLTSHPDWKAMLARNPARTEAEHRAFLEGSFPPGRVEVLTVTRTQRVVAFDSGPLAKDPSSPAG
jgi:SAM-dependent methyltransferase